MPASPSLCARQLMDLKRVSNFVVKWWLAITHFADEAQGVVVTRSLVNIFLETCSRFREVFDDKFQALSYELSEVVLTTGQYSISYGSWFSRSVSSTSSTTFRLDHTAAAAVPPAVIVRISGASISRAWLQSTSCCQCCDTFPPWYVPKSFLFIIKSAQVGVCCVRKLNKCVWLRRVMIHIVLNCKLCVFSRSRR